MNYPGYQVPVLQQRINQMEQQYPQFQQNGYYSQPTYPSTYPGPQQLQGGQGLKGRPVTSIDEAKASMIDLDGSVFIFPDFGNNKIYTKQINLDGTASIKSYTLETQNLPSTPQNLVNPSQKPFNVEELLKSMQDEIDGLKLQITELKQTTKGGKINVESNTDARNDE